MLLSDNYMDEAIIATPSKIPKLNLNMTTLSGLPSDRTIYEDEDEDMTFKVKYNMSKDAKESLIRMQY